MARKPTYEELEQSVKELEKELSKSKQADEALYQGKEKYRQILISIEEGYYEVDLAGNLTFFNDSLCNIYGYARDELMGMNNREYMATETAKKTYEIFNRVYKTGKPTKIFDWEFIKKDGTKVDVEISVSLIRNSKGQAIGFRGIVRDIGERKRIEAALQKAHNKLEMKVEERTAELVMSMNMLEKEIEERKRAELAIIERGKDLENKTHELEEVNAALKVLLKHRDEDKKDFEEKIVANVKKLVFPYVEKLYNNQLNDRQMVYLNIIKSNLVDIIAPFLHQLSSKYSDLTPSEIQIAGLVKDGKTSKEIADLLNSSTGTIDFHRNNLRKKLGLLNTKTNLRSFLLSFP